MSEGQPNQRMCATCGEPAGPNDRYCRHCGAPLPPQAESSSSEESSADFPTQRFSYFDETSTTTASESITDEPQPATNTAPSYASGTTSSQFDSGTQTDPQDAPRPTWQAQPFSDFREEKKPNRNMWWIIGAAIVVVLLFCCCMLIGLAAVAAEDNTLHRELEHIFQAAQMVGLLS